MAEKQTLKRFFVDNRNGCVAVRDRNHPEHDPDYQGLHFDTPGVVLFIIGTPLTENEWTVSPLDIQKCNTICDYMNSLNSEISRLKKIIETSGISEPG